MQNHDLPGEAVVRGTAVVKRLDPLQRQSDGVERDQLLNVAVRAREREVQVAIYTEDLFTTYNDVDNRAAIAAVPTSDLNLVGVGLYADRRVADKILKGLRLLS